ncbi:FAD-binding oxidoreductase [Methylomonas sp. MgM2]
MDSNESSSSHFFRRLFSEKKLFNIGATEQKINYLQLKKQQISSVEIDQSNIFGSHRPQYFKPKLIMASPKKPARHIPLYPNSEIMIGSHILSDITITGFRIADFHAKITVSGHKIYVQDLHSHLGTFVDGQRLTPGISHELADGSTVTIKDHRFHFDIPASAQSPLSQLNKEQARIKADSDCTCSRLIDEYQRLDIWKSSLIPLKVTAIINETIDTKTIRLASDSPMLFHYQPGQFVTLHLNIDGQEQRRSFSIASSPSRPYGIEITVKKKPGGLVSNWLHNHLREGDRLMVKGPMGRFSCFNHSAPKLLLISAGSGVVPIMSMLRWLSDVSAEVDVLAMLSFRYPSDIIYRRELNLLKKRHKNILIYITLTGKHIGKKTWPGPLGRIDLSLLKERVPDLTEREVFMCGLDAFMVEVGKHLQALKLPAPQLHKESFSLATPIDSALPRAELSQLKNRTGMYRINFAKSGVQAVTNGDESLLMLAHLYGIKIDNECLTGSCGECMVKCLQGDVTMGDQVQIGEREKQAGWIYSCSAFPKSDLILDI